VRDRPLLVSLKKFPKRKKAADSVYCKIFRIAMPWK